MRCCNEGFDGSGGGLSQQGFELGEELFDGVEVWAVGGQVAQLDSGFATENTMWMSALTLMPYLAIASSLVLVATVIGVVYSQPARIRAAGFAV